MESKGIVMKNCRNYRTCIRLSYSDGKVATSVPVQNATEQS